MRDASFSSGTAPSDHSRGLRKVAARVGVCIGGGTTSNDLPTADGYQARTRPPEGTRTEVSALPAFRRDNERYDDPLFTLGHRSALLFSALREWAAIALYRLQGKL